MTLSLSTFLLARIAEDEEALARIDDARQEAEDFHAPNSDDCPCPGIVDRAHEWDCPERLRAECTAKRRIVERHKPTDSPDIWIKTGSDQTIKIMAHREVVLAALALPYADHPDYREVWRP